MGTRKGIKDGTADAVEQEKLGRKVREWAKNRNKKTWREPEGSYWSI